MSKTASEQKRAVDREITNQPSFRYSENKDGLVSECVNLELDWNLSHYDQEYLMVDIWAGDNHLAQLWIDEDGIGELVDEVERCRLSSGTH